VKLFLTRNIEILNALTPMHAIFITVYSKPLLHRVFLRLSEKYGPVFRLSFGKFFPPKELLKTNDIIQYCTVH
jgi:hypothetical protein